MVIPVAHTKLKNGVAQGSVLAPTLYNIYTSDFPDTSSNRYIYADDAALAVSAPTFQIAELKLSNDMTLICNYLEKWRLKISMDKTVSSVFHIKNHLAKLPLKVCAGPGTTLKFEPTPKYLGVRLDRSLTFKKHISELKCKVSARVALLKRLAGTSGGASFQVLRTSTIALVYAPAEYCVPTRCRSTHAHTMNVPLNEAMRVITGCIRSTPTSYLPFLAGITPPRIQTENYMPNTI